MKTKTDKNDRSKTIPDLMGALSTSQRKATGQTFTADQLANCFEAEAKKLQGIADILRGKS